MAYDWKKASEPDWEFQAHLDRCFGTTPGDWAPWHDAGWGPKTLAQPAWDNERRLPHGGRASFTYNIYSDYKPFWRGDLNRWIWAGCGTRSEHQVQLRVAHMQALYG